MSRPVSAASMRERALAVVGDTEHADVLRRLRADPDPAVAGAAERALGRLTDRLGL